ncbi:MAG: hypothetical protein ACYC26_01980 [Phycisphaerales bacterium]
MLFGSRNRLGLALGDRTIQCAQVATAGSRSVVERLARYELPPGVGYEQPEALGALLQTFLREHHFAATHAMIGLPLRWLVTHTADLPPADPVAARAMLRLHVERLSSDGELDMVYDCVGEPGGDIAQPMMLVGVLRQQLDRIGKFADAAGLTPAGVAPTALIASAAMNQSVLLLADHGTELVVRRDGAAQSLRHWRAIPHQAPAELPVWSGELRRARTLAGQTGPMTLVDAVGLDETRRKQLDDMAGGEPMESADTAAEMRPDALNGASPGSLAGMFMPAIALGAAGRSGAALPVNFTRSRLTPPPVRRFGRWQITAVAAGLLLVTGLAALYVTMRQREGEATRLEARFKQQQPELKAAKANIARFNYGRRYFEMRPPVLDCLKEITQTFRDGEPIWVTTFTMRDTGKGRMQGKSTEQRVILAVLDRLRSNANFSDVQLQDMREGSGREREVMFSISLTYHGGRSGS